MDTPGSAEIRIVRRKKGHGGHHGGAWKVAFADFMTAMFAFFLVMWICGQSKEVQSAVSAYFKDPIAFNEAVAKGNAPFAIAESTVGGPLSSPGEGDGGASSAPAVNVINDSKQLDSLKSKIEKIIADTPEFKDLKDFVDVKLTGEGLQIELLEVRQSLFFDSGSSQIKPKTRALIMKIGKELCKVKNKMVVEGHTDSLPLRRGEGYTNWELSSDRANGARRILETSGLKHGQIVQVRGLADNKLRDKSNPKSFINRRVSIILLYNKTQESSPKIVKDNITEHPSVEKINPDKVDKPSGSLESHESSEVEKKSEHTSHKSESDSHKSESSSHKSEPDSEAAYKEPPMKTGTGKHEVTVVTRDGKVYTVKAGDITEGLIPKVGH